MRARTYEPPIPDTPTDDTPRITLGSNSQGEDLGWIQPWDRQPRRTERKRKDEDHAGCRDTVTTCGGDVTGGVGIETQSSESAAQEHADTLHDGSPIERPTTSDSIERKHTDERGKHVKDVVETRDPLCLVRVESREAEDGGCVDGDTGDTDPFLDDLEPDDELNTSTDVQFAATTSGQHRQVARGNDVLLFHLGNGLDLAQFGFRTLSFRGRWILAAS